MRTLQQQHKIGHGMALIVTLLVIVILTICATAFMQSMSLERRTSRAYLNMLRADEAAKAAEQAALTTIGKLKIAPASAVYVKGVSSPETPYLYLASAAPSPAASPTVRTIVGHGLFSTARPQPEDLNPGSVPVPIDPGPSIPDVSSSGTPIVRPLTSYSSVAVNINQNGMVGLRTASGSRLNIPVNWIYLHDPTGKVTARCAFWCEDESSKIDLRLAGNLDGSSQSHRRRQGDFISEVSVHVLKKLNAAIDTNAVSRLLAFRETLLGKMALSPSHFRFSLDAEVSDTGLSASAWDSIAPYVTVFSKDDDRMPDGRRKLDLNALAANNDRLKSVQNMRTAILQNLPDFGSRYYRFNGHAASSSYSNASPAAVAVTDQDKSDYITKLCANILDFIDADHQPTVIVGRGTGETVFATRPNATLNDQVTFLNPDPDALPVAIGREAVPFLSEYVLIARPISPADDVGTDKSVPVPVIFRLAHYIELRNYSDRTLRVETGDFGANPFIQIVNRPAWQTSTGPATNIRPPDIELRLPDDFELPPNGFGIVTTDSSPPDNQLSPPAPNAFVLPKGSGPGTWSVISEPGEKTELVGTEGEDYSTSLIRGETSDGDSDAAGDRLVWEIRPSVSGYSDASTRILIGNDSGLLDMLLTVCDSQAIRLGRSADNAVPSVIVTYPFENDSGSDQNWDRGNSSSTTFPRFFRGDLRANMEIRSAEANGKRVTKFAGVRYGDFSLASLGSEPPKFNSDSTAWHNALTEFTHESKGNFILSDATIQSVTALGGVMDPASVDKTYRPSYRTLRIGQSDDPANNRSADPTAWSNRIWIGGLGFDDPASLFYERNAHRLLDVFRTNAVTSGRINPNSIARGSSVVFDAITDNFIFNDDAIPGFVRGSLFISGKGLKSLTGKTNLYTALKAELDSGKHFLSVGDLSRLAIFSSSSREPNQVLAEGINVSMKQISDAGREEFLRRSENLLTTHPLSFSIYAIGQSGEFSNDTASATFRVYATTVVKSVVTIEPVYPKGSSADLIVPASWNVVTRIRTQL